MQIEQVRLEDIKPYENNPRLNDGAVEAVANSIREFGFKNPIIVDADNVIVAGHTRYKAAQALELQQVPVIRADDLTPEQVRAFRLADNKTAELAEWDLPLLDIELDKLGAFDMSDFGFDSSAFEDDYGTDFELPADEKSVFVTQTFTLHENQRDFIQSCLKAVNNTPETFGNTNSNGNALYEICKQWAEQKKSK